jgi:general secretion pathway protein L
VPAVSAIRETGALIFNTGVGIDITPGAVSIAVLKGSFTGIRIAARGIFEVDGGRNPADAAADMAAFINGFIRDHGMAAAQVYAAMPGEHCILREITFPRTVRENLRGTLAYEMEKYVPFSADDVYFDGQIISEDRQAEKIRVLLAVLKKADVQPWLQLSSRLETGFSGITIAPAAVANYFIHQHEDIAGPVMIIDVREDAFDLIHIREHALVYARTIRIPDPEADIFPIVAAQMEQAGKTFCAEDAQIRFTLYKKAGSASLRERLAGLSRFEPINDPPKVPGLSGEEAVTAVGLALKGLQKVPVQLEFMPPDQRRRPDRRGMILMLVLAALLVLSGMAWIGNHFMARQAVSAHLDMEIERLRAEADVILKKESEIERMAAHLKYLSGLRPGNRFALDVFRELSERIPETAWLRELRLLGDAVTLSGQAASASELIPLLEESPMFKDVKFLATIRKDRDGKEVFRIGLTLSK